MTKINKLLRALVNIYNPSLIFFVYPGPMGSEENQFTPLGVGVNKLIFKRFLIFYARLPIVIYYFILKQINSALTDLLDKCKIQSAKCMN